MTPRVIEARYVDDYVIWLRFDDGLEGEIDLKDELRGPVFLPLKNEEEFKKFRIHPDLHTIAWENEASFAPEFLYDIVKVTDHRIKFLIREMTKEFRNVCASVAMVVRTAPSQTVRLVVLTLGLGSGPAAILYIQKIVIDEVVEHKNYSVDASLSVALIVGMIAFVTCNLLMDSIETFQGFRVTIFGRVVEGRIKERVYHKVATFNDIALFETPELLNELELALRGVGRLRSLTAVVGNLLIGTFMVIPVLVLSASIGTCQ